MTIKVLVVDDSMMMRLIVGQIVACDQRFEVVGEAANGVIALELARELKPDIILLDIEMPHLDGIDTLKRLMLVSKAKTIVISSVAQAASANAAEARRFGACAVIPKPSGAFSLDIRQKKGHEIMQAMCKAAGLPLRSMDIDLGSDSGSGPDPDSQMKAALLKAANG
ncbi:MAG: response regulator [Rhodospirillaceae bacterium]